MGATAYKRILLGKLVPVPCHTSNEYTAVTMIQLLGALQVSVSVGICVMQVSKKLLANHLGAADEGLHLRFDSCKTHCVHPALIS